MDDRKFAAEREAAYSALSAAAARLPFMVQAVWAEMEEAGEADAWWSAEWRGVVGELTLALSSPDFVRGLLHRMLLCRNKR